MEPFGLPFPIVLFDLVGPSLIAFFEGISTPFSCSSVIVWTELDFATSCCCESCYHRLCLTARCHRAYLPPTFLLAYRYVGTNDVLKLLRC